MPKSEAIKQARSTGHYLAELCANNAGENFQAAAYIAIKNHAEQNTYFTVEDVREANPDIQSHDARAWGAPIKWAEKDEIIEANGAVPVVSSRGGYKTQWRSLIFKGGSNGEPN